MSCYTLAHSRSKILTVVFFCNCGWYVIHIPSIDILCSAACLLVDCCYYYIQDGTAQSLCLFTLSQQHSDIKERAKNEQTQLRSLAPDIYDGSKL